MPDLEMQRDGTLMVRGDPVQLQERLRQGGVDRVLRRKGGVLVGLDQVHKARQSLQQPPPRAQASADPSLPSQPSRLSPSGQQFSRSAPDQASQARGLPSKPATVQSVRAAVAKLTNSMGLLAEGRGRVVVATSADIQAHWEPLIGEVDMGSQDIGLAQGFFDPSTDTVFLIADHIEAGQEMAVAAHELAHKHGKAVLGEAGWKHLHEVIGSWANRPEGSLERRVYDEAMARVQASRPDSAAPDTYSSEELFPYAVQVAMELGVQPTALMPANSVQGWLARVRAAMHGAWDRLTNKPELFDSQDLVDLAFAVAQRENPAYASAFEGPSAWATSRDRQVPAVAEAAYELMYRRGQAAMGETGWLQLHEPIGTWANATEGSTERRIHDEALRLMQASLHGEEATAYGATQALFPYAVQAALQMRIQPTAKEPINTAAGWLARVRGGLRSTWNRLATDKGDFNSMDLVDLAFALAQQENPLHRAPIDEISAQEQSQAAEHLRQLSGTEGLFAFPKSSAVAVTDIAADHNPSIEVHERRLDAEGITQHALVMPSGAVAIISTRDPTVHEVYGLDE